MKCRECPDYRECNKKNDLRRYRHHCAKEKEKKVFTNADRIRAMSDEELADMMTVMNGGFTCHECFENNGGRCNADCVKNCFNWLKQPAEEVEDDTT